MPIRPVPVFEKLPEEEFTQRVEFAGVLSGGETIASAEVTATDRVTGASAASILSGAPTVDGGNAIEYDLTAGAEGARYLISVVGTLNTGEVREQWIEMQVPRKMVL